MLAALVMTPLLITMNPAIYALGFNLIYALVCAIIGVTAIYVLLIDRVRGLRAIGWSVFWFVCLIVWTLIRFSSSHWVLTVQWVGILLFFAAVVIWPLSPRELDRLVLVGCTATLLAVCLSMFGGAERIGRVSWFVYPNFVGGLLVIYAPQESLQGCFR